MENLTQNVDALFNSMENFTQKEGLIGKPVTHSDKTFLPIVSVTVGFGGGDSKTKGQPSQSNASAGMAGMSMGGGASGFGAKLCTDAIVIIDKDNVTISPIGGAAGNISQIIDKVPEIVSNMTSSGKQQGGQQGSQQQGAQQQGGQQNKTQAQNK